MNSEYITNLKEKIIADIESKTSRLESSKKDLSQLEHGASDELDQSQSVQTLENINKLNSNLEQEIIKLRKALKNINSPDFGFCEECGIEIPSARLENNPSVVTCFDCQTIIELEEKKRFAA